MTDLSNERIENFRRSIQAYFREHGRDLAWRRNPSPYNVVVSEVMLQQTQVGRVEDFFARWVEVFPDFASLSEATTEEVLGMWQGLGYNRRALWLKRIAVQVYREWKGRLPNDPLVLRTLPGIGVNTAGSIAAFSYQVPTVFIETNIRRVYINEFFAGQAKVRDEDILVLAEKTLDRKNPREWYWGLMDYGSHLAKLITNPNRRSAHWVKQSKFIGSARQLRGDVLRQLLAGPRAVSELGSDERLAAVLGDLSREGFIESQGDRFRIASQLPV